MRYDSTGIRDERLDLLRGYAVFAMSVNHLGIGSRFFTPVTGGSVFLINAAEVFFFISGLTLGMISRGRDLGAVCSRCYRRCWQVYAAVLLLAAGGLLLGDEALPEGGIGAYVGTVASLRDAPFWSDVLVAYVIYLLIAPAVLALLSARRTRTALAAIAAAYLLSRIDPDGMAMPIASFRNPFANAPLFLGGLVLGWHRDQVFAWWASRPWRLVADGVLVSLGVLLLAAYVAGGARLPDAWWSPPNEAFDLGTRESRMPAVALVVVAIYLRCLWLLVDRGWGLLRPAIGWLAMPLGRAALTGYVAHAFLISLTWRVIETRDLEHLTEGFWSGTIIGGLFAASLLGVVGLSRVIASWWQATEVPHPLRPAVTAGLLVAIFSLGAATAEPYDGMSDSGAFTDIEDAIWERYGDFDREDAPLVVEPMLIDELEEPPDNFEDRIAEVVHAIIMDEARRGTPVTVAFLVLGEAEDGDQHADAAGIAGALERIDDDPPIRAVTGPDSGDEPADTVVLLLPLDAAVVADEDAVAELLGELESAMDTARSRSPESLLVVMPVVFEP